MTTSSSSPRESGGAVFSDPVALAEGAAILRRGLARRATRLAAEAAKESA